MKYQPCRGQVTVIVGPRVLHQPRTRCLLVKSSGDSQPAHPGHSVTTRQNLPLPGMDVARWWIARALVILRPAIGVYHATAEERPRFDRSQLLVAIATAGPEKDISEYSCSEICFSPLSVVSSKRPPKTLEGELFMKTNLPPTKSKRACWTRSECRWLLQAKEKS